MQLQGRPTILFAATALILAASAVTTQADTCEDLIENPTLGPPSGTHVEVTFLAGSPGHSLPEFATEVVNQTSSYVCLQVDVTADNRPGGPDTCGACENSGNLCTSHSDCEIGESCDGPRCTLDLEHRIEVGPNDTVTVIGTTPSGTLGFPGAGDGCAQHNQCDSTEEPHFCSIVRMANARVVGTSSDGVNWTPSWHQLCVVPTGGRYKFVAECPTELTAPDCCDSWPTHPACE